MGDVLTAKTTVEMEATRTVGMDVADQKWTPKVTIQRSWADGTGTGAAQDVFCVSRSITAAAFENIDLTAAAQDDDDGDAVRTVVFVQVKAILIENTTAAGTGGYLVVGGGTDNGAAADAWIGTAGQGWFSADAGLMHIPNQGVLYMEAPPGITVTNATNDILGLGAVTQDQTYTLWIIGDTA